VANNGQVIITATMNASQIRTELSSVGVEMSNTSKKVEDSFGKSTSKIGGMFSSIGNMANQFGIPVGGALDGIGTKFEEASAKGEGFAGKLKAIGGIGGAIAIAGIGALAVSAVNAAAQLQVTQAALDSAFKGAGQSTKNWQGQIDQAQSSMSKFGFTNDDVNKALAAGVIATGKPQEALKNLSLSADLARYKHIDLSTATEAVDRALTGNLKPLKQLGIDLPIHASNALKVQQANDKLSTATSALSDFEAIHGTNISTTSKLFPQYQKLVDGVTTAHKNATDATDAHTQILDALTGRLGGQASAYADTYKGRIDALKASFQDIKEKIGKDLLPVFDKVVEYMKKFIDFINSHKEVMIGLGILVGVGLAAAFYSLAAAVAAATIAMLTNPITWIIIGVAALIVGIVLLVKHWNEVWGEIQKIFGDVVKFLRSGLGDLVLALLGPVGAIIFLALHWKGIWKDIKDIASDAWHFIYDNLIDPIITFFTKDIPGALDDLVGFFQGLPHRIASAVTGIWGGLTSEFENAINWIIDKWNNFHIPALKVMGVQVTPQIDFPNLPHLASGGPLASGQMALVGEQGPELFMPSVAGSIIPNHKMGTAGGQTINVYVTTNADANQIAAEVAWAMKTKVA